MVQAGPRLLVVVSTETATGARESLEADTW